SAVIVLQSATAPAITHLREVRSASTAAGTMNAVLKSANARPPIMPNSASESLRSVLIDSAKMKGMNRSMELSAMTLASSPSTYHFPSDKGAASSTVATAAAVLSSMEGFLARQSFLQAHPNGGGQPRDVDGHAMQQHVLQMADLMECKGI